MSLCADAGRKLFPTGTVYCASKWAVEAITQGVRLETAGQWSNPLSLQLFVCACANVYVCLRGSREQRAKSKEQRAKSKEQRAESKEQRAKSKEQRAERCNS